MLQDIDHQPGFGAFWGEVQSAVHLALGVLGCVTNGAYRDTEQLAPGFQILGAGVVPSHAHVHMLRMGDSVDVAGMRVLHGDVIHADAHGAVVVPADAVTRLPAAIDLVLRREKVILDLARAPGFTAARMREALRQAGRSTEVRFSEAQRDRIWSVCYVSSWPCLTRLPTRCGLADRRPPSRHVIQFVAASRRGWPCQARP